MGFSTISIVKYSVACLYMYIKEIQYTEISIYLSTCLIYHLLKLTHSSTFYMVDRLIKL